jgi:hypothetical protein
MGTGTVELKTGTGADLLKFKEFHHVSANAERLTRVATADLEWLVKDWDGELYVVKFNANFSKKHLFTFSKSIEKTKLKASQEAAKPGQAGKDAENWHNAEIELLKGKIVKNLDKRAVANMCNCGHPFNAHLSPNPAPPPANVLGACTTCVAPTPCAAFQTPYGLARKYVGKPTHDPLAGATTTRNTCIILNWVPKSEFEEVVVKSIQAHEKPVGWTKGNALAVPVAGATAASVTAATRVLKWDFGPSRVGAIIVAQIHPGGVPAPVFNNFKGCYVKAKKIATDMGKQTWEIFHMETSGTHVPF